MRFLSIYICALGIFTVVAQPLIMASTKQALEVLHVIEHLQNDIHAEIGVIDRTLSSISSGASEKDKDDARESIQGSFERMITKVSIAADAPVDKRSNGKGDLEEQQIDLSPILIGIFDAVQDIVQDLDLVINRVLNTINHSQILQDLLNALIVGLLKLIDVLLVNLLKVPFAEQLRGVVNKLVSLIPI